MQSLRAFLLVALACSAAAQLPSNTIVQNALLVPQLSTLVQVLSSPGYESILQALNSPGNFTVFAPVNDAFATAGLDPTDVAYVSDVLLYHVIGARVHSGDLSALQFAPSLLTDPNAVSLGGKAQNLEISRSGSTVNITFGVPGEKQTTATVVIADVECSNGVVHVVDTVLIPPARTSVVATAAGLTSLVNAVVSVNLAGVVDNTSSLTIFAPINAAFAKVGPVSPAVLTQVLEYHVVPAVAFSTDLSNGQVIPTVNGNNLKVTIEADGSVFINDARVLIPNVLTANGVVHVIDSVLLPPTTQMPHPHAHHQHHGQKPIEKITRRH